MSDSSSDANQRERREMVRIRWLARDLVGEETRVSERVFD